MADDTPRPRVQPHLRGFKKRPVTNADSSYVTESNDFTDASGDKPTDTGQAIRDDRLVARPRRGE